MRRQQEQRAAANSFERAGYPMRRVAQICNLPYRRFAIGRAMERAGASRASAVWQNAILRYHAPRQNRNRIARSVWSAASLLPLANVGQTVERPRTFANGGRWTAAA